MVLTKNPSSLSTVNSQLRPLYSTWAIHFFTLGGNMITFFSGQEEEEDNDEDNENEYEDEDEEEEDNNENEYLRAAARVVATTPVAQAACSPLLSKAITWQETPWR